MIMISLTGVVWIALALRQLNLVTSQGQDSWLIVKMTLLAVPFGILVAAVLGSSLLAQRSL